MNWWIAFSGVMLSLCSGTRRPPPSQGGRQPGIRSTWTPPKSARERQRMSCETRTILFPREKSAHRAAGMVSRLTYLCTRAPLRTGAYDSAPVLFFSDRRSEGSRLWRFSMFSSKYDTSALRIHMEFTRKALKRLGRVNQRQGEKLLPD